MSGPLSLRGQKYPAKEHAQKVLSNLKEKTPFFISGYGLELWTHCDQTRQFRQNRYFYYLTGCNIPGSHVLYTPENDKLTLFLPDYDEEDVMWSGPPLGPIEALEIFDVDEVLYTKDIDTLLKSLPKVYTTIIDKFSEPFKPYLTANNERFYHALDESRMIKDNYELELMRHAAAITDKCHLAVMSATPIETHETHIHAEFMYHALRQGLKYQLYDPICCAGTNCLTLHYVKNDEPLTSEKHSVLIDAGAEWSCYALDVTRCFPINGDWKTEHLEIYNIVLKMQRETMRLIKPGASWDELHLLAHRILIKEFKKLGIFRNFNDEEIFESNVTARFFPHGLGHLLGLDTHDVGGNPDYEDPDPKLRYLRLRRSLRAGMVLTDEPGIYFSPFLLEDVLKDKGKSKYIDQGVLERYWYVGGVRIEDDILVTSTGYENFTRVTSDPKEISKIISKSKNRSFHNVV